MILGRTPARLLVAAFWTLFGAVSGLQIWISMLAHHHSLPLITLYQVITWDVWIVYTIAIGALVARAPLVPPRARGRGAPPRDGHRVRRGARRAVGRRRAVAQAVRLHEPDARSGRALTPCSCASCRSSSSLYGLVAVAFHAARCLRAGARARAACGAARDLACRGAPIRARAADPAALPVQHAERHRRARTRRAERARRSA